MLLGFKENEIYERKEYSIVKKIKKIFKNQIINEHYRKRTNSKREQTVKEETGFDNIRINPDEEDFDIDDEIGAIQDFIYKSGLKLSGQSTKKSLIEGTEKLNKMVKQLCVCV